VDLPWATSLEKSPSIPVLLLLLLFLSPLLSSEGVLAAQAPYWHQCVAYAHRHDAGRSRRRPETNLESPSFQERRPST
jgi:hypothetical protein